MLNEMNYILLGFSAKSLSLELNPWAEGKNFEAKTCCTPKPNIVVPEQIAE
jgi:hypothetical protein